MTTKPTYIVSASQMYDADSQTIKAGTSGFTLMTRAGEAMAKIIAKRFKENSHSHVLVLCGPGNNGGDGWIIAEVLAKQDIAVRTFSPFDTTKLKGDAKTAFEHYTGAKLQGLMPIAKDVLVVDALFGVGLDRDIEGQVANLIKAINKSAATTISVDMASGLHTDTGAIMGVAVKADETLTVQAAKLGHFMGQGVDLSGNITLVDIGIDMSGVKNPTSLNAPNLWQHKLPRHKNDSHKYDKGHLIVVGGEAPMSGAARLAARAGLRIGAGLVTTACPKSALDVYAKAQLSVMAAPYDDEVSFDEVIICKKCSALVIGPGMGAGSKTREKVLAVLKTRLPTVLDADALSAFQESPAELFESLHAQVILTPHEGEFNRLFPDMNLKDDKFNAVKGATARAKCVILLKGANTIISSPKGAVVINNHASVNLATAGSGDVLAGIIAGLMAQKMAVFDAACAGAWIHGSCAIRLGRGLIAEDLVEEIPQILRQLLR